MPSWLLTVRAYSPGANPVEVAAHRELVDAGKNVRTRRGHRSEALPASDRHRMRGDPVHDVRAGSDHALGAARTRRASRITGRLAHENLRIRRRGFRVSRAAGRHSGNPRRLTVNLWTMTMNASETARYPGVHIDTLPTG